MVWAISECPGTEQNINIKGAIYNFQKVELLTTLLLFCLMDAVCSGTMSTWEGKLIQIVVAVC